MATNGNTTHQEQWRESGGAPSDAPSTSNAAGADSTPSKDEVGWYFVQQYYTTLSKNPDKLHVSSWKSMALPLCHSANSRISSSTTSDPSSSKVSRLSFRPSQSADR